MKTFQYVTLITVAMISSASAVIVPPPPPFTSLLQNGSFEEPLVTGTGGFDNYTTGQSFPGWTVGSGDVDIVRSLRDGEVYQAGLHVWPAADGNQSVDLNGYGPGSIYQDFQTVPGATYQLTFALAGNVIGNTPGNGILVSMDFLFDDNSIQTLTFDTTGHDGYDFGWTYYQFSLTAASHTSRLAFRSLSTDTGSRGPAIDDVRVFVPEGIPPVLFVPDDGATLWLGCMGFIIVFALTRSTTHSAARNGASGCG